MSESGENEASRDVSQVMRVVMTVLLYHCNPVTNDEKPCQPTGR